MSINVTPLWGITTPKQKIAYEEPSLSIHVSNAHKKDTDISVLTYEELQDLGPGYLIASKRSRSGFHANNRDYKLVSKGVNKQMLEYVEGWHVCETQPVDAIECSYLEGDRGAVTLVKNTINGKRKFGPFHIDTSSRGD